MDNQVHTFNLDPFQEEAISALQKGISVVVSAPTGSGKTAIAEYVIEEALKGKERVFYTTPLKALSNQKFHDFQKKYGKENVGIVTGDTAINRDAQIVVMTTEIYRNMLYGTILGTVDENLKHLRYLVLDECHYMNDPDRGTVWEESIIYSPAKIQILALSATIANAKELTDWISSVHGHTELIESFHRPVPLRFYYFKESHLYPLLTPNKQLNPQLKEHKDSFKAHKQKFKDLQRLGKRKEVKIPQLVSKLNKKGFLPGIYFVFSRRGCEQALKDCQELIVGAHGYAPLLTHDEKKMLSKLIQEKTYKNNYLFKHKHLGFLYQGMAVHHAGLLPQWKELVEFLFTKGLIKAVFATETLAAGINMPAKTTIISNLGKRGDLGHKNLSSNEFLQMSGRAGRRGMDKVGNVVVKETHDHTPAYACKLATSNPDPLISQFTPNYSMALNLLQRHSMDEIKDLLSKSFGQYLINKHSSNPKHFYWDKFLKITKILSSLGYIKDDIPTEKGIMAASLRGENIVLIAEVLSNCNFSIQPEEFAACISALAIDETRPRIFSRARHSYNVDDVFIEIQKIARKLFKLQRDHKIEFSCNINPLLAGIIQSWCKQETKWEDILRVTNLDEGDIVRAARRTMDLLKHIKNAPYLKKEISDLAKSALEMMDKEPVKEIV